MGGKIILKNKYLSQLVNLKDYSVILRSYRQHSTLCSGTILNLKLDDLHIFPI